MDKATEPDKRATVKAARRQQAQGSHRGRARRRPPRSETLTVAVPPGSRHKGYETYTIQDLVLVPQGDPLSPGALAHARMARRS